MKELEKIRNFYDNIYYKNARYDIRPSWHLTKLADLLDLTGEEQFLDVACGKGEWLLVVEKKGARIAGVDISRTAIDICRKNLPKGEFLVSPAETLPFGDARFDIVTCLGSLEHFVDKLAALREMVRVAKPNARLLILVPNEGFYLRRLDLYKGTQQAVAREDVLSLEAWRSLIEKAGLRVVSRWRDTHILSAAWITSGPPVMWPIRLMVALSSKIVPIALQYQVYHLCQRVR